ncbi:MAG: YggS family pyridoxal phosphate-dependent enzyme [Myxococcales bacterium]|nr:YggS family pyridoxal phosphate-dependent enzyme [Myxococcales bacterium]USN51113.1 MAG: YggS family pyridoxal phosphate-dependent enzyme [Myxococcales bacterium]
MQEIYTTTLKSNLNALENEIKESCLKAQRSSDSVKLIAVSKGQDFQKIVAAYNLGLRDFGESYAQEFVLKREQAQKAGMNDIKWHFIGAIQTNKIKLISKAHFVHSIDSISHAQSLSKVAPHNIGVFLQINLSGDQGRHGFSEEEIIQEWPLVKQMDNLNFLGIMTILPLIPTKPHHYWFSKMQHLKRQIGNNIKLSMGMSTDFSQAIIAGADFIRIGERLFGKR